MTVKSSKAIYRTVNGETKRFCDCSLFSTNVPSPLPTITDIPGYTEDDQIEVGSTLFVVSTGAVYIADEDGEFIEQ